MSADHFLLAVNFERTVQSLGTDFGWEPIERYRWRTPDGETVRFIAHPRYLEGMARGQTIFVAPDSRNDLETMRAIIVARQRGLHVVDMAMEALLELARAGLASSEMELALILETHCKLGADLEPIRETLEDEIRDVVEELERDIKRGHSLIACATSAP